MQMYSNDIHVILSRNLNATNNGIRQSILLLREPCCGFYTPILHIKIGDFIDGSEFLVVPAGRKNLI